MSKRYLNGLSKQLSKADKPIVFWDTCSLLDIFRFAYRDSLNPNELKSYLLLLDKIEKGEIISISSELVLHEYNSNIGIVKNEYSSSINKTNSLIAKHFELINLFRTTTKNKLDISGLNLINDLENLSKRISKKTYFVREEKKFNKFAHFRVKNYMAPAARKGEYKDCYIWGTCLSLADKLKQSKPIFFLTKNISDFYVDKKDIHPDIVSDCTINNVKVTTDCGLIIGFLSQL